MLMVVLICYIAMFYIINLGTNDISWKVGAIYDGKKNCFSKSVLSPRSLKIMVKNSLPDIAASSFQVHFRRQVISLLSVSRESKICTYLALRDLCSQASHLNTAAQEQTTHITLCLHQWSKIWRKQYSAAAFTYPHIFNIHILTYVLQCKKYPHKARKTHYLTWVKREWSIVYRASVLFRFCTQKCSLTRGG